jgi:hypothetical protein
MTLPAALLNSSQIEIDKFSIRQIVALCGDGKLADQSLCSVQLREYFQIANSENLKKYLQTCLQEKFDGNGFVLQDIVNELGRRLEYTMENGLYRGKKSSDAIGFDGLWRDNGNDRHIVVEVKTTDAYSINLDDHAGYREKLISAGKISDRSSILLVVGREETGSLEAQVRGSKHAWTIRIISTDALAKLVALKEDGKLGTVAKIHELLIPFEHTKLDRIIEIAFAVAEDATAAIKEEQGEEPDSPPVLEQAEVKKHDITPPEVVSKFRASMVESLARDRVPLVKKSRALYWSADRGLRVVVTISKQYTEAKGRCYYWFAYHSDWDKFLSEAAQGFYVLGCIGRDEAYALPFEWIHPRMQYLYVTKAGDKSYCHVFLYPTEKGGFALWLDNGRLEPIDAFRIALHQPVGAKLTA